MAYNFMSPLDITRPIPLALLWASYSSCADVSLWNWRCLKITYDGDEVAIVIPARVTFLFPLHDGGVLLGGSSEDCVKMDRVDNGSVECGLAVVLILERPSASRFAPVMLG